MKLELMARLKELLSNEDITSVRKEVKEVITSYNAETSKEKKEQEESWRSEEHEEGDLFEFSPSESDLEFEELVTEYKRRHAEFRKALEEEQQKNLEIKRGLLNELKEVVEKEENIGKAFSTFNHVKDKWAETGNVPSDKSKEIFDQYTHLKDDFFYNIKIYKELQEHDLKINEKKKQDLIEKARSVNEIANVKERDLQIRGLQDQWLNVGPSPRETYKEMGDEFFGLCREVVSGIREHYDVKRGEIEENLRKKTELIAKVGQYAGLGISNHGTWTKKTKEIIAIQSDWKSIGFAGRVENEDLWKEFRSACDKFFKEKQAFYDKRKEHQKGNRKLKEALIAKAKELSSDTDWKTTTSAIIQLQNDWKKIGPAAHYEEQKLWTDFRGSCDKFFKAKKEFFGGMDERQENNLKEKEALIAEIQNYEMVGKREPDLASLKEFSTRFNAIGYVPKKNIDEIFTKYNQALEEKYAKLDMKAEERRMLRFNQRIEGLKEGQDGSFKLRKERGMLLNKLDKLEGTIRQYQNNVELFTGKGADTFKKDIEKRIVNAQREKEEILKKIDLIDS